MFAARLRAYAPGGASLGLLPDPLSWQASVVHGDLGALTVTYSTLSAGGALIGRPLTDGLEVAVEVWDGSTWVEPRGCRFVRVAQGADTADDMQVFSVTFRAWGWLLSKARLTAGTFTDRRRVFAAPKAGSIVGTVLAENASIGGVPVTVVGGGSTDAAGASWPALPDQNFGYADDYLGIVRGLQEAGALDWATQARGLYLYLPDSTALSPDLSATVRLRLGLDIGQAPADETIETLVSQIAVRAQTGGTVVVDEPTAPVPWGEWQGSLAVGQVDSEAAATAMGQAELERTGRAREQYTRDLILHDGAPIPLVAYGPGAWITAPTSVAAESVRVQQVTLTYGADGYSGNVVLNDRLVESDIRRARTLATLAGGQVGSGGAPLPIAYDPEASRTPSTPTGLDITAALTFTGPTPRGVVTATWNVVTTATDSGTLTIAGYELQWRIGAGAWQTIVTPEVSAVIADLTPGDAITVRVRAVGARTTLPSAWSATDAVTVPGDVTAPPVPNAPEVSSRLGVVGVAWDGGPTMPADFARIEVALGDTTTPTTVRQTLTRAGVALITGETYGGTRYARLRSVDTSGNTSAWSTVSEAVLVNAVQGPDLEANSVTTNALAAGVVDAEKLNSVINISGLFTTSEDGAGQRIEIDPAGLRMISATEALKINFPTADDEDPTVRARIQADGLTVYEGATFYSTLNEFARDSEINLAEQIAGPLAGPVPVINWTGINLQQVSKTGALGTFALVPSEVIGIGQDYQVNTRFYVLQKRSNGTRVWTYTFAGALTSTEFWDIVDWEVTGFSRGSSGEAKYLAKWAANGEWYLYDGDVSTSQYSKYPSANPSTRNTMGYNGTDILVGEKISTSAYRLRRMQVNAGGADATVLENVNSTGVTPLTPALAFIYKGSADFGSTKWVVSHQDVNSFRVFSTGGAFDSTLGWLPPVQKAGGLWNPADSFFYTLGANGVLYKHPATTWTDPTLDTWHVGQSFYDSNATGGTHETALGTITSFAMKKRANVSFALADVPYAGGTDDPNEWRFYAKRGAAPASDLSDMKLQASGAYTVGSYTMTAVPTTGGSAALEFGTFPNASPAKLHSGRTFAADPTKHIFEARGDGSGHWGSLEVSSAGVLTDPGSGWINLTLLNSWVSVSGFTAQYAFIGSVLWLRGRVQSGTTTTIANLTSILSARGFTISQQWTNYGYGSGSGAPVNLTTAGLLVSGGGSPLTFLYGPVVMG